MTCAGALLLASGCSGENPLYDLFPSTDTEAASSGGNEADDAHTAPLPTSDTGVATGATGVDGTEGPACMLHPFDPIDITFIDGDGTELDPICGASVTRELNSIEVESDRILHYQCDTPCDCLDVPPAILDLEGSLTLPDSLPTCARIELWTGPEPGAAPEDPCVWLGFAVFDTESGQTPVYVAANTRFIPQNLVGDEATIELVKPRTCDGPSPCDLHAPGEYELGLEFTAVPVGSPREATIGFFGLPDYLVTNRMSSVTPDCHEYVSWTGELVGPIPGG